MLLSDLKPIVADMNIKYENQGNGLILVSLNGLRVARVKEVEPNKHYEIFMESISQEIVKKETKKQVNFGFTNKQFGYLTMSFLTQGEPCWTVII